MPRLLPMTTLFWIRYPEKLGLVWMPVSLFLIVNPSRVTLLAARVNAGPPPGALTTDSPLVPRVRASMPALAPSSVSVLLTLTAPGYVPGQTLIVSFVLAALTADWMSL